MDYSAHYNRLIDRARTRSLTGYKERHHILPRCLGGSDAVNNLVDLTAEEHYVAHQLLTKLYPHSGPLAYAVVFMAVGCTGNKAYGWLRRRILGIPKSEDHKRKIGLAHKGKIVSAATRKKLAEAQRGKKIPRDVVEKSASSRRGLKRGPTPLEVRQKLSASQRGTTRPPFTAEHRANMSKAMMGNKRNLGKKRAKKIIQQQAPEASRS